ncbi:MAG: (d)CMP kinase [Rikenellaceae bacterium]
MEHKMIIAIDGYSSCGKSTYAKLIAKRMGYVFIDTGAMYRAVTLFALQQGVRGDALLERLGEVDVEFVYNQELGRGEVFLNGENVDRQIRSAEVNALVSEIATLSAVRAKLVEMQRKMGDKGGVVMDGRDIGTVVFPNADIKIFMEASVDIRARRRFDELGGDAAGVDYKQIAENIAQRDFQDENRKDSPLHRASDAVVLDNSTMTLEEQMLFFENLRSR